MELTIGIVAAFKEEMEPFLELNLEDRGEGRIAGRPLYHREATYELEAGERLRVKYQLLTCGVGKVRAASATQALISLFQPDLVLNVGTAGALLPEIAVGDMVVTKRLYQVDSQLHERYACESDSEIADFLFQELQARASFRVYEGNGTTGDIFVSDLAEKARLARDFAGYCCDMESAAIADTCAVNEVPFCVIRVISDSFAGDSNAEFEANYGWVSQRAAQSLGAVLPALSYLLARRLQH